MGDGRWETEISCLTTIHAVPFAVSRMTFPDRRVHYLVFHRHPGGAGRKSAVGASPQTPGPKPQ